MQDMLKNTIAIIGATGNVGRKIVEILIQRNKINALQLKLFASDKSAGTKFEIGQHHFIIENINTYNFQDCHLAIFATDSDVSKKYIPRVLAAGCKVVDTSSAYRLDPDVPLIVPPVNATCITDTSNLISTANCVACPISVVLKPLHDYVKIKRVLISTYQSTSGAGKDGMDELSKQIESKHTGDYYPNKHFTRPIAFNVIPHIDKIQENGFSGEENKIAAEIQKIVSPDIKIAATSVRVPVMIGHSISLFVEFTDAVQLNDIKNILKQTPSVQLSVNDYSTPLEIEGQDDVFVGRLRIDPTVDHGILLWLVSDNLRRGAALDAAEIAEIIVVKYLFGA